MYVSVQATSGLYLEVVSGGRGLSMEGLLYIIILYIIIKCSLLASIINNHFTEFEAPFQLFKPQSIYLAMEPLCLLEDPLHFKLIVSIMRKL